MACEPQFQKGLNFECIMSIVNDVRSNNVSVDTAVKAVWTIGCGLSSMSKTQPLIATDESMMEETKDTLCNQLENLCSPHAGPMDEMSVEIAIRILVAILRNWIL